MPAERSIFEPDVRMAEEPVLVISMDFTVPVVPSVSDVTVLPIRLTAA